MMVSTLRPPARKKKSRDDLNGNNNKGKKRKAPPGVAAAALYSEDLGMVGVKQPSTALSSSRSGPILKGPEGQKFQITETAEEKLRRLRRKARFDAQGGPKKKTPKTRTASLTSIGSLSSLSSDFGKAIKKPAPSSEPDFLSSALSSGRSNNGNNRSSSSSSTNRSKKKKRTSSSNSNNSSGNHKQLVGTCQDLEKPYLRLTTYPKPENIRPLAVLVKSLGHIKNKYYQEEDFMWANEQLKSVRQDITVQRLKGRFVLDVYETHARILLEHGDLAEFNQCQTMIRYLTTTGVEHDGGQLDTTMMGSSYADTDDDENDVLEQTEEHSDEFRAYHVLYALVQNSWDDLTRAMVRVRDLIQEKGDTCNKTASGRHALEVVKSVTHNDYRAFFKLYANAPHMSAYLMDFLVKRMREKAYERIIAAYRPTICVEFFRGALYFSDLEETRLFLRQMGAKFVQGEPPLWVDCKASASKK